MRNTVDQLLSATSKESGPTPPLLEGSVMMLQRIAYMKKQILEHPKPTSKVPL